MTAAKIELYLKPSGSSRTESTAAPRRHDELERAEAYDDVTLASRTARPPATA